MIASLPPLTRLLFAGLWLLADREGRMEDKPGKIKAQLFPYHDADINTMLRSLTDGGWLIRYASESGDKFIQIVNFKKHQHIHPDEKISVFPAFQEEAGDSPGISGDFKRSPEIMPYTRTPSTSTSTSPKQPGQGPIDLKKLADAKAFHGDFGSYRLPRNFGTYGGRIVADIPADECLFLIQTMNPGPKVKAALQWRIDQKTAESKR